MPCASIVRRRDPATTPAGEGTQVGHARLAEALSGEPDIEPAEVADHWRAADRPDLEVSHRVAAARRAGAGSPTARHWTRGFASSSCGMTARQRPRSSCGDVVGQALESAVEMGDLETGRDLAGRALAFDLPPRQRAVALTRVGVFLIDDGRADEGLPLLDEALELLEALPPSPGPRPAHRRTDQLLHDGRPARRRRGRSQSCSGDLRPAGGARSRVRRGLIASIWLTGRRPATLTQACWRSLARAWRPRDPIPVLLSPSRSTPLASCTSP